MIPKIIHYCWFGGKEIPENLRAYMDTWQEKMPGWAIMHWDEASLTQTLSPHLGKVGCWLDIMPLYVRQAYEAKKYAFVSDYVRLWALEQYGGVYMDTDVEVLRPFDELPEFSNTITTIDTIRSFIGFEESKAKTLGTNVIGCEPHCAWVREMLEYYETHAFVVRESDSVREGESERYDMTANSELVARLMEKHGLVRNGKEQVVKVSVRESVSEGVHVYDYHVFSPITSTRVMRKNKNTFSIHHFAGSWVPSAKNHWYNHPLFREIINALIQVKRFVLGKV